MDEFYSDERYCCPGEFQIARVSQWLRRGELTAAEHTQALRELDPHDEVLIARMTISERFDERECRLPAQGSPHFLSA